mmetsp:Transcript_81765/g.264947  ORF Transcript_81765/g.264947 Transcript_81765/m.264947 type:complete len:216 (-) Transcript_81765:461-1108(-)
MLHCHEEPAHRRQASPRHAVHAVHERIGRRSHPGRQCPERLERGWRPKGEALDSARPHRSGQRAALPGKQHHHKDSDAGTEAVAHDRDRLPREFQREADDGVLHVLHDASGVCEHPCVCTATVERLQHAGNVSQLLERWHVGPDAQNDLSTARVDGHQQARALRSGGNPKVSDVLCLQATDVLGDGRPLAKAGCGHEFRTAGCFPHDLALIESQA